MEFWKVLFFGVGLLMPLSISRSIVDSGLYPRANCDLVRLGMYAKTSSSKYIFSGICCATAVTGDEVLTMNSELLVDDKYPSQSTDKQNEQLNPDHTIPTLVDNDVVIWDSHEIVSYLVEKYGEDDSLYPKDSSQRALVDQKLNFYSDTLLPRINAIITSIVIENEKEISTDKISAITEAYKLLDAFLEDRTYLAGDCLTIADFCCVATVSTATIIIPISTEKYPNLSTWYRNFKNFEYYEETNGEGLNELDALVELKLGRPRNKELCD